MPQHAPEQHFSHRIGWLRASVLGANDGVVSTASLVVGVAAAQTTHAAVLIAGIAGLVAGAMSMAAGEYVSVSSQADTEKADLEREANELAADYDFELAELAKIYELRGLDETLSMQVAEQLMAHDALAAHARDELGLMDKHRARPIQAAWTSAATFTVGAAIPLLLASIAPQTATIPIVSIGSLIFLALLGAIAARAGGASMMIGAGRVTFWGALAMGLTAVIGDFFGTVI